jgi:phosphoribosylanthranilate isomerase
MTKLKICGLRRPEDICMVNEAMPDYAGFIIEVPKSKRNVSGDQVRSLTRKLRSEICTVGVFVNAPLELVQGLLSDGTIAMAQLHGNESTEYVRELRQLTNAPVIQAFSIREKADIDRALTSEADYILLDQGGGGSGIPFDWNLVPEIPRPWFLAGGLSSENIQEAIHRLHPYAVDLSSSLEVDGYKDAQKIREATALVRNA